MIRNINVKLLKSLANPLRPCWGDCGSKPITKKEIDVVLARGTEYLVSTTENTCNNNDDIKLNRELHIKKIAWFVKNGWKEPIWIDVGVPFMGCYVNHIVDDGNHRFSAAIFRGDKEIKAEMSGSIDYMKELGLIVK